MKLLPGDLVWPKDDNVEMYQQKPFECISTFTTCHPMLVIGVNTNAYKVFVICDSMLGYVWVDMLEVR